MKTQGAPIGELWQNLPLRLQVRAATASVPAGSQPDSDLGKDLFYV